MPEDDFDIYGEDDGFTTKGQVVRRSYPRGVWTKVDQTLYMQSLEDYDENAPNDILDNIANSPVVGEKRQREDEEHQIPLRLAHERDKACRNSSQHARQRGTGCDGARCFWNASQPFAVGQRCHAQ